MKTYLFFILFFPIILIACESYKIIPITSKQNELKKLKKLMSNATILCKQGNCPPFVGGLFSIKTEGKVEMMVCSASLIAPDQLLTNSHCFPEKNPEQEKCQTTRIVFPKTDQYPLEVFGCAGIINQSPYPKSPENPDWIILKLDRASQRPPLAFNTKGFQNKETVTLYKIDFKIDTDAPFVGNVVKTSCLSNTHHFLSLQSVGPQSPLFNISDCDQKIIPGNSGVAVLDKEGKMKGLFSFFLFKREDDQSLQSLLEKYLSDKIKDMKENVGGGTNALCISAESKEIPDRCDFDPHVNRRLGILHGYLSRQKKDPNVEALGSEIHQMNMENYDFIRFERIDPNEDLSDYISFNVHPPMEILKSYHLNKAFAFILPSFPECIDDSAENSFTARLGLRTPSFFEKHFVFASLNENHSSTIENKIEWESFLFERDEKEWIYKMTVAGETESLFTQILGLEYGHNFQLIVPFCE